MPAVVSNPTVPATSTFSKRRRFQPPITNFFSTQSPEPISDTHALSHNHYSAPTCSATPVVPLKVQASLLSVGMRVRKSVADGYKTNLAKTDEKASLPAATPEIPSVRPSFRGNGYAELAPFSGFPKSTPESLYNPPNYFVTDDGDAFSLPASSQESSTSSASFSIPMNGQKRGLDSDIFPDDDYYPESTDDDCGRAPVGRRILSPKLGQQARRVLAAQRSQFATEQPTMDVDDFEEASFLRRREEVDADYVQMDWA
ncbi:hypothetical protein NUU61_006039 [Penicillium alfredii]|uniref:Uncharacterized protein n=1 Tax=Penicillium alfredii TaxID=1506179 RepID=A0A9W9K2Y3_9EURO|nr:uncharacterized protein NUU61_006039 [Penicillium alfredii]KAJ5091169.1 hypothetical protein NUU61_006039 [Penicillium alfredii]